MNASFTENPTTEMSVELRLSKSRKVAKKVTSFSEKPLVANKRNTM